MQCLWLYDRDVNLVSLATTKKRLAAQAFNRSRCSRPSRWICASADDTILDAAFTTTQRRRRQQFVVRHLPISGDHSGSRLGVRELLLNDPLQSDLVKNGGDQSWRFAPTIDRIDLDALEHGRTVCAPQSCFDSVVVKLSGQNSHADMGDQPRRVESECFARGPNHVFRAASKKRRATPVYKFDELGPRIDQQNGCVENSSAKDAMDRLSRACPSFIPIPNRSRKRLIIMNIDGT
uniref:Uncharacterized protein n=1 Tax=Rhodopseudomonas palustris (strain DX-1) TaxID=652103 RepID=E6VQ70_RHOPX